MAKHAMPTVELTQILITSRSATVLIDTIKANQADGYRVERLWYEYERGWFWFWVVRYYVRMALAPVPPPPEPHIEFIIGPITMRDLPKPPEFPHLEFMIGPIGTKDDS